MTGFEVSPEIKKENKEKEVPDMGGGDDEEVKIVMI